MNAFIEPRTSRKDAKAATRAKVLEAAKAQLEELGFDGTSIRGIAQAAGVATGTVLLHFSDKRDLLHAAVFEDLERTWADAKAKLVDEAKETPGRPPLALSTALSSLVKAFFDYYASRPALSRVLLRESLFAEPPWNGRFSAQIADVHVHVAALATEAKSRGELKDDVDPNVFGASFFSFYYFALLAWLQGGHPSPQQLFERMLEQHLSGLVKESHIK